MSSRLSTTARRQVTSRGAAVLRGRSQVARSKPLLLRSSSSPVQPMRGPLISGVSQVGHPFTRTFSSTSESSSGSSGSTSSQSAAPLMIEANPHSVEMNKQNDAMKALQKKAMAERRPMSDDERNQLQGHKRAMAVAGSMYLDQARKEFGPKHPLNITWPTTQNAGFLTPGHNALATSQEYFSFNPGPGRSALVGRSIDPFGKDMPVSRKPGALKSVEEDVAQHGPPTSVLSVPMRVDQFHHNIAEIRKKPLKDYQLASARDPETGQESSAYNCNSAAAEATGVSCPPTGVGVDATTQQTRDHIQQNITKGSTGFSRE